MSGGAAGRRSAAFEKAKRRLRAERRPCALCGAAIDYDAERYAPDSFEVDHIEPLSKRPDLADDPANMQATHRRCNLAKGAGDMPAGIGITSRRW